MVCKGCDAVEVKESAEEVELEMSEEGEEGY